MKEIKEATRETMKKVREDFGAKISIKEQKNHCISYYYKVQ